MAAVATAGPSEAGSLRAAESSKAAAVPAAPSSSNAAGTQDGSEGRPKEGRQVSCSDIQLVQNLIERCLQTAQKNPGQLYMSQREVVATLAGQARIEAGFTALVWQKLEEQNPDFFRAYYTRLKLKDQIVMFNHLLDQQVQMVQKMQRGWLAGPLPVRPGMPVLAGMPMMQPGMLVNGQPVASGGQAVQQPDGSFRMVGPEGGDAAGGGGTQGQGQGSPLDLGDLAALPEPIAGFSAPVASPPLFTGDAVGELSGVTQGVMPTSSNDLAAGLSGLGPISSPIITHQYQGDPNELSSIPRNFSLSDLSFGVDGEMGLTPLPRNFSLSALSPLDLDH